MGPGKGALSVLCAEELGSWPPQGPQLSTALDSSFCLFGGRDTHLFQGSFAAKGPQHRDASCLGSGTPATWRVGDAGKGASPILPPPQQANAVVRASTQRGQVTRTLSVSVGLPGQQHPCVLPLRVQPYARLISSKSETLIKE